LQECFETPLKARKSLVNDFEQQFNLSCEIAGSLFAYCFSFSIIQSFIFLSSFEKLTPTSRRRNYYLPPAARGTLFVILKRTVIGHWSFVIGEINNTKKQTLIGRGCQPPAPWTPCKSFSLIFLKNKLFSQNFVITIINSIGV
jgi:hypothetical protein